MAKKKAEEKEKDDKGLSEREKMLNLALKQIEKDYEEIAKNLNLPLGTVKAHIFRGRELLNKYLKDKLGTF